MKITDFKGWKFINQGNTLVLTTNSDGMAILHTSDIASIVQHGTTVIIYMNNRYEYHGCFMSIDISKKLLMQYLKLLENQYKTLDYSDINNNEGELI